MEKSHKSLVKYIIIVLLIQVYRDVHFVPIQWCYLHIPLQCGSMQQLLRWQVSLSAEVNKNVNLGYSQDQVYSQFQGWGFLQGKIALPNIISSFISSLIHIHDLKIPDVSVRSLQLGSQPPMLFQINLGQLLFRVTLKVKLGSWVSLLSKWTTCTAPKTAEIFHIGEGREGVGSLSSPNSMR